MGFVLNESARRCLDLITTWARDWWDGIRGGLPGGGGVYRDEGKGRKREEKTRERDRDADRDAWDSF